ncbi:host-nuclease inhibitor Gam family protein [Virgibacillus sp. CBA3643]|uniref:host-nuclease inhibitor Gam family protein n=1 Tax=Virgibacillus sp. CBA3643 TaxID=2942278 RepID=UPI0035A2EF2A
MNELKQPNESLQEFLDEQEQVESVAFTIKDDSAANWALRKIKQHQQQQEANNKLYTEEVEKLQAWNKQENEKAQQSIDYFQGLLSYYAMKKREDDPKFKSQKLPNGRLQFVKQQPKWEYNDDTVLKSLKAAELGDFIQVKEAPKKADIKKAFEVVGNSVVNPDTGEIIEGITVEEREEKFGVVIDD